MLSAFSKFSENKKKSLSIESIRHLSSFSIPAPADFTSAISLKMIRKYSANAVLPIPK